MSRGTRPQPPPGPGGSFTGVSARAPNIDRPRRGVNFAALLLALAAAAACTETKVPAPVDPGTFWPTYMGNVARTPFLDQQVSSQPPSVAWVKSAGAGLRDMPVVTDKVIIAATTSREIRTINLEDGEPFWHLKLKGPPVPPLVVGGVIYAATEGEGDMRAITVELGEKVWERRMPSIGRPMALSGDTLYASADNGALFALRTNTIDWSFDEPIWVAQFPRAPSAGPIVFDEWVVYIAYDSIFVVSRMSGQRRAAAHSPEFLTGEAAADGDTLFLASESGSLMAWRVPELDLLWLSGGFGVFKSGPVIADSTGYAITDNGDLVRFRTDDGSARVIARSKDVVQAAPSVVQNGVLVGTLSGRLHFFRRNGDPVWEVQLDGQIIAPVFVRNGSIVVPMYGRSGSAFSSGSHGRIAELR